MANPEHFEIVKDLVAERGETHILDFFHWKDHDAFESAFADLLSEPKSP